MSAAEEPNLLTAMWGSSLHLTGRLLQLAQLSPAAASRSEAGGAGIGSSQQQALALALVRAVPNAAAALQTAAGCCAQAAAHGTNVSPLHVSAAELCCNLAAALKDAWRLSGPPASTEAITLWLHAAAEGIRLQPLLSQLSLCFHQLDNQHPQLAAEELSAVAMQLTYATVPVVQPRHPSQPPAAAGATVDAQPLAPASLTAVLWLLHTQLCRLIQRLAGGGTLPGFPPGPALYGWVQSMACRALLACKHLSLPPPRQAPRRCPCLARLPLPLMPSLLAPQLSFNVAAVYHAVSCRPDLAGMEHPPNWTQCVLGTWRLCRQYLQLPREWKCAVQLLTARQLPCRPSWKPCFPRF